MSFHAPLRDQAWRNAAKDGLPKWRSILDSDRAQIVLVDSSPCNARHPVYTGITQVVIKGGWVVIGHPELHISGPTRSCSDGGAREIKISRRAAGRINHRTRISCAAESLWGGLYSTVVSKVRRLPSL
jgi:hypothetical protein